MVVVQASKVSLPHPSFSSSSPHITSLLFEPTSQSLALMHSDSSFSLYPSFSLFSPPPPPQTLIPPPASSASFLLLNSSNHVSPRVLFLVCGPHRGGSRILLRFYLLRANRAFARAQVVCAHSDIQFDPKLGVLVNSVHGVSIKLAGSVNFFAMHSVSSSRITVFAVKVAGDDFADGLSVKLMRCAVIECSKPVWSISVSFGFLIFGEDNGVRVFDLRRLARGRVKKFKNLSSNGKLEDKKLGLPNGPILGINGIGQGDGGEGSSGITCNGYLEGKIDKHCLSVKQRSVKFRQDSAEKGACFVALKSEEVEDAKSTAMPLISVKAISIQALSSRKFIILDSTGDLHLLRMFNPGAGSDVTCNIRQLPHFMRVQKLAILPDTSIRAQTVWVSDGNHSVHMMAISDMETAINENDRNESEDKLMQISGFHSPHIFLKFMQAIFASEKIQDAIPLAANAILILGEGSIYSYEIS